MIHLLADTGLGTSILLVLGLAAIITAALRGKQSAPACTCPAGKGRPCYACSTIGDEDER